MKAEQTEKLMRSMRERALRIEAEEKSGEIVRKAEAHTRKVRDANKKKLERLTKLYFDAGRWAGGAKDHVARQAFELVNRRESER